MSKIRKTRAPTSAAALEPAGGPAAHTIVVVDRIGDVAVHAFDDDGSVGNCQLRANAMPDTEHGESAVCSHGYQAVTSGHSLVVE